MNNSNKTKIILIMVLLGYIIPFISSAQIVSIFSKKNQYNVGDTFLVEVKLNSLDKKINSLGGNIIIPTDLFDVYDIGTGKSFIPLWVEEPNYSNGVISFSGGLPGGFSGLDGVIFDFVLKVKKNGIGKVFLNNFDAFLNDGEGTIVDNIELIPLVVEIKENVLFEKEIYTTKIDTISPESFDLLISKDQSIENDKYFLSFFTVDKDSGIARYEVEEKPWILSWFGYRKIWPNVKSPLVLKYQNWVTIIKVTAFDLFENKTEEIIIKPMSLNYIIYLFVLLFVILTLLFIRKKIDSFNNKRKRLIF